MRIAPLHLSLVVLLGCGRAASPDAMPEMDAPPAPSTMPPAGSFTAWRGIDGSDFGPATTRIAWGSLGGSGLATHSGRSTTPVLLLEEPGHPWVAWEEETYTDRIFWPTTTLRVRYWTGTAWERRDQGLKVDGQAEVRIVRLLKRAEGPLLVVASVEQQSSYIRDKVWALHVRRWNGTRWEPAAPSAGTLGHPLMAWGLANAIEWERYEGGPWRRIDIDSQLRPVVLFGYERARLMRWDGTAWTALGPSAEPHGVGNPYAEDDPRFLRDEEGEPTTASRASLTLDGDRPVVVWINSPPKGITSEKEVYLRRWNGTAWEELGESAYAGGVSQVAGHRDGFADEVRVVVSHGNPIVAWYERNRINHTAGAIRIRYWNGSAWAEFNYQPDGLSGRSAFELTTNAKGDPVLAYASDTGVQLIQWDSYYRTWEWASGLPGVQRFQGKLLAAFSTRRFAAGSDLLPYATFAKSSATETGIYLGRWSGQTWEGLGAITATTLALSGRSIDDRIQNSSPSLAMDSAGHPIVAWQIAAKPYEAPSIVRVRRHNGTSWEDMPKTAAAVSEGGQWPHVAASYTGEIALGWVQQTRPSSFRHTGMSAYHKRWDVASSMWQALGAAASGDGLAGSAYISLPAISQDGAFYNLNTNRAPYQRTSTFLDRFQKATKTWERLGDSVNPHFAMPDAYGYHLVLGSDGAPVVSFANSNRTAASGDVYLRRWDEASHSWSPLGHSMQSGGVTKTNSQVTAHTLAACGSAPCIVWQQGSNPAALFAKRWNARTSSWIHLGAAETSLFAYHGRVTDLSATTGPDGLPIIAFAADPDGPMQIYVLRWNGQTWTGLAGSDVGRGISNSDAGTFQPDIAYHQRTHRLCVTWQENGRSGTDIALRCLDI